MPQIVKIANMSTLNPRSWQNGWKGGTNFPKSPNPDHQNFVNLSSQINSFNNYVIFTTRLNVSSTQITCHNVVTDKRPQTETPIRRRKSTTDCLETK